MGGSGSPISGSRETSRPDRSPGPGVAPSMSILGRLALLFVVVPLVELAFLIQVGGWVGIWPTVGLVFLTGILGATLARAEGLRTLWSFQQELAAGKLPGQPLLDGLCILVGGALLLTPGFVTDLAGFSLLLPPTRRLLQRGMKRRLRRMMQDGSVRVMTTSDLFGGGRWGSDTGAGTTGDSGGFGRREGATDEGSDSGDRSGRHLDPEKEISQ